jgi:transcriptional/translational regulatory protein YebC/TACO1
MASKLLEGSTQYHFDRNEFCSVFHEIFTNDEIFDIEVECEANRILDCDFFLIRSEDEFSIIHKDSGTIINWYKHLGRTNSCNKEAFTLDDLREFLTLLKEDMKGRKQ